MEVKDTRPDWDTYFMQIAHVVKLRANCSRRDREGEAHHLDRL